jgi:hypothetical protein
VLIEKGKIFNRPIYEYLDAGESITKTYVAFLVKIPKNYKGVNDITMGDGILTIKESGNSTAGDIIVKTK